MYHKFGLNKDIANIMTSRGDVFIFKILFNYKKTHSSETYVILKRSGNKALLLQLMQSWDKALPSHLFLKR